MSNRATNADNHADVIVIGLGGMGSAAAYHLANRGVNVIGLERFTPAHNQGSSHGGSRIIRQSYFEDPAYVPLLLRSYELWEQLKIDSGHDVYSMTGGIFVGPPDCTTVAGSLRAAQQWDLPHELLTAAEVTTRFPTYTPEPHHVALYERAAGFARPELTVTAHLELAVAAGATLNFGEQVRDWDDSGSGVTVTTDRASYTADQLVICPGAWAPVILEDLGVPIHIERQVLYWLAPDGPITPYVDAPIFISENANVEQIYGFPAIDGPDGGVKVAHFRKGVDCTAETIDRTVYPHEIAEMHARATQLIPGLSSTAVHTATCMYANTPDEHFVVARHPGHEHVTVACGFSGHGFKFVPVVGEILADLATLGTTSHPIALFDPARLTQPV